MKKRLGLVILILITIVVLTGCASTIVSTPSSLTIENAMEQLGAGFVAMKKAEKELHTGLVPDEVEVTFNVAATGGQNATLNIDATPIPVIKAGANIGTTYTAQRNNQITVKFKNLMYADPSKVIAKDPEAIRQILEIIMDPRYAGPLGPLFQPKK